MVHTYGLTHINLVVRDVARSVRFYGQCSASRNTAGPTGWSTPGRRYPEVPGPKPRAIKFQG
jgi:catechol 2,3-dioxygenase-like lactoylglutathione lyase family enzyme